MNEKDYIERSEALHQAGKWKDVLALLQKGVKDFPKSPKVWAELASAYSNNRDPERAITSANTALGLDPRYAYAFAQRAWAYSVKGEYEKALADWNHAIELEPDRMSWLRFRSKVHGYLRMYRESLSDIARFHLGKPPSAYRPYDSGYDRWFAIIHDHLQGVALPNMRSRGERLIDYWPIWVIQDLQSRTWITNGQSGGGVYGTVGTGYAAITDCSIRVFTDPKLTKSFKLIRNTLLSALAMQFSYLKPSQGGTDRIPFNSITTILEVSEFGGRVAHIRSLDEDLHLVTLFEDHFPLLFTAVRMAVDGEIQHLWNDHAPSSQVSTDILSLLHNLDELRRAGLVTEEEYVSKRRRLLRGA